jgi:hypothetical protein
MRLKLSVLLLLLVLFNGVVISQSNDTITLQTFSFGSPQDAWFEFPSDTVSFEKILMQYTLKCNPAQSPACGEWDYLTYTYLYKYTGLTDSSVVHQPLFLVNANAVDSVMYSNIPTYINSGSWQYYTVNDDTTSLLTFAVGSATNNIAQPFATSNPVSRSFYLWRASELSSAGMTTGSITGLRLNLNSAGSNINNLVIRIKHTSKDSLNSDSLGLIGFTEVFRQNFIPVSGWNHIAFLNAFNWDGVSNLVVEISYENLFSGVDNDVFASNAGFTSGLFRNDNDRCVYFRGGGYIPVHLTDSLLSIDSLLSVSFMAYGNPDYQPQDGTCFEGVNSAGNRVINGHIPWSNLGVYWDAGNDAGSYDRINKTATTAETEGQWNRWTFTKNAITGNMKIYLNGSLWHSGTGFTRDFDQIASFRIGKGNWSGSNSYEGRIDEFAIFKTELTAQEVADFDLAPIDATHPQYDKLIMYFPFNEGNGNTVTDLANGNSIPSCLVGASNPLKHPDDYISGFSETTLRPDIIFEQGVFNAHTDSVFVAESVMNNPIQIIFYADSIGNPGQPTDTIMVWPAGYYRYEYDAAGIVVDSTFITPDSTLFGLYYDYYNYFPQVIRFELARYITPYGNGLSLGNGWTWTFDVSDYRTLLADSVRLAAGNWQELLDMKFLMIKGTPPRNVVSIQNLWNGGFNYGISSDPIENKLTPLKVKIPANAQTARWKSRITGHGMDSPQNCAEFCAKYHYFKVDSTQQFAQLVWRDNCDINPLYPQGGTWVYDRANWCPGAEVWTYDFELTPFITPGDSVELDHDVQPYTNTSGWDYFQIEDQLVTYGPPNFTLDAAIDNVLAPTTNKMWKRLNPICSAPVIIIRNNGSTPLTSLDINYGISGSTPSVYHWIGNLPFLQTETVELDTFAWAHGASSFEFSIGNPNGGTDQYAANNSWKSVFEYVPVMPSQFVILLRTNNNPSENSYTVSDDQGNIVFERSGLTANTTYSDTMNLTTGCYHFRLIDTGEDGLQWWANTAQGTGYIKFKSATNNVYLVNFGSDFGGETFMQFTVGLTNDIDELSFTDEPMLKVYPNPVDDEFMLDFNLPRQSDGTVEMTDMFGKVVYFSTFNNLLADSRRIDVSSLADGVYFVSVRTQKWLLTKKVVVR